MTSPRQGERYHALSTTDQDHLVDNLVTDLTPIDKAIQRRAVDSFTRADLELGKRMAEGLRL